MSLELFRGYRVQKEHSITSVRSVARRILALGRTTT